MRTPKTFNAETAEKIKEDAEKAVRYRHLAAGKLGDLPLLDDASWLAIVLLSASVTTLIAGFIRNWLPLPGIGVADRLFGLAFGLLEGAAGLGLMLRVGVLGLRAPAFDGSLLAPVMLRWWLVVAAALPPELGVPRHL